MAAIVTPRAMEHWKELRLDEASRAKCAAGIEAIKKTCATTHTDVPHVYHCDECFPKITECLAQRYQPNVSDQSSSQDQEWFAHRRAFLVDTEAQLAQVKEKKLDLESVEKNVYNEREAWYRGVLRKHSDFVCATGNGIPADELKEALEDLDRSRDDLVDMVWRSIGSPADWEARIDDLVQKWAAVADKPVSEQKELYIDIFFKDPATGQCIEGAEQFLEDYRKQEVTDLAPIIDSIMAAKKSEKTSAGRKATHQSRLDELRRAKTAFEQNKALSKARQRAAQASAVGDQLYELPSCTVCHGNVQRTGVLSCPVCQIVCQVGGDHGLTVFCSTKCQEEGQEKHIEQEHDCEAHTSCIQEDSQGSEDDGDPTPVVCKECLDAEKRATIFCSPRCAAKNIGSHRQNKHETAMEQDGDVSQFFIPLPEVVGKTFKDINPGLKYSWV